MPKRFRGVSSYDHRRSFRAPRATPRKSVIRTTQEVAKTAEQTDKNTRMCLDQADRRGYALRRSIERDGSYVEYGSTNLSLGAPPSLNTSYSTVWLVLDRMDDHNYEYPDDMYGGMRRE